MEMIVKRMIQVAGTTYCIVRLERDHHHIVRSLRDVALSASATARVERDLLG